MTNVMIWASHVLIGFTLVARKETINFTLLFTTNATNSISRLHIFCFHSRPDMAFCLTADTVCQSLPHLHSESRDTFQWASQAGMFNGMFEIAFEEALWLIQGSSCQAIWSIGLPNVTWYFTSPTGQPI